MAEKFGGDPVKAASRQPAFFDDPAIDRLMHMFVALAEEVAVVSERLDTHEHLLSEKGLVSLEEFQSYEPSPSEEQERLANHKSFIARLLNIIQQEIDKTR